MLMDCAAALEKLRGTALEDACEKLCRFDMYHLLFRPSMSASLRTAERFVSAPADYLKWSRLCGGGSLQICEMLGEKGVDPDTGLAYETYDEYEAQSREAGLPPEYRVFAVANFGDYFCFRNSADGALDSCVYQWGLDEGEVVLIWDSFSDWLSEQVDTWVEMIADGELDPIEFKLEDQDERADE